MDVYLVVSRNGVEAAVDYPEGEYPTLSSARIAADEIRENYPLDSAIVREGWFTQIEVLYVDSIGHQRLLCTM